ncbi:hypothetical protein Cgig2_002410 [Carnegiea gigantea]|uniref:S1 motif domain-containing protein n=1 Tax=Carnegiea gigantea TaxID=171969 RepID=A0A9Q1QNH9_9CARY|nr:hypothetical protein Cgig2_002410 [Carnegiea gigantea]
MGKLSLSSTSSSTLPRPFLSPPLPVSRAWRKLSFSPLNNPKKFSVFASKDEDSSKKLDQWDLMELKFGRMHGEDPKLTMAKIMGRKVDPDASYMEIEKNFYKNKGKMVEVKEVPFDVPEKLGSTKAKNGLNLVKPEPKKGIKVGGGEDTSNLPEIRKPSCTSTKKVGSATESNVQNVILRKPTVYNENDGKVESSSRLSTKPNLTLSMRTEPVQEKFCGSTLLKRPEPIKMAEGHGVENENNLMNGSAYNGPTKGEAKDFESGLTNGQQDAITGFDGSMLRKPKAGVRRSIEGTRYVAVSNRMAGIVGDIVDPESRRDLVSTQDEQREGSHTDPSKKVMPYPIGEGDDSIESESFDGESEEDSESSVGENEEDKLLLSQPLKDIADTDWKWVEQHFIAGHRVEVELISCGPGGFVVSFGSLIGYLPYSNLAATTKFLSFASWLRKNGLSPFQCSRNLGIIGNGEVPNPSTFLESSSLVGFSRKAYLTADMELEDLFRIYEQERMQYLSSFIGKHIKVNILFANKKSRRLIFSVNPVGEEEIVEKKRSLMAKLSIGDVVKCCITKITYHGIFVEVEGVPAMIQQSEVPWDANLDPASCLKTGQPDPLNEASECTVGNSRSNGGSEAAWADSEWPEVDSLVKALQEIDGVQSVNKGRFFLSPGLHPTFQVYMASVFEDQYKLLARSANKAQEVIVRACLGKEEMKSAVLQCINGVKP